MQFYQQTQDESEEPATGWTQSDISRFISEPSLADFLSPVTAYFNSPSDRDTFVLRVDKGIHSIYFLPDMIITGNSVIAETIGHFSDLSWILLNPVTRQYEIKSSTPLSTFTEKQDTLAEKYALDKGLSPINLTFTQLDFNMPVAAGRTTSFLGYNPQTQAYDVPLVNTGIILVSGVGSPVDYSIYSDLFKQQQYAGRYLLSLDSSTGLRDSAWAVGLGVHGWIDDIMAGKYNDLDFSDPQVNSASVLAENKLPEELSIKQQVTTSPEISTPDFAWNVSSSGVLGFTEEKQELIKDVSTTFMTQLLSSAVSHYAKKLVVSVITAELGVGFATGLATTYDIYSVTKPLLKVAFDSYLYDLGLRDTTPSAQEINIAFGKTFINLANQFLTNKDLLNGFNSKGIDVSSFEKIMIKTELNTFGSFMFKETHSFVLSIPSVSNASHGVTMIGGEKRDFALGSYFPDSINGAGGNDHLSGMNGNDTLNGGAGADKLVGGLGNDTFFVDDIGDVVTETSTLVAEIDSVNSAITYTLGANIEKLILTGTAAINGTGNNLNNTLLGNAAANILLGGTGNDILRGGVGNDSVNGGAGNDILRGGAGNDVINGGEGVDWVYYDTTAIGVSIDLYLTTVQNTMSAGLDTLIDIENILGSDYADKLFGNSADNLLNGGSGNDILRGGAGDDKVNGDTGNDILRGGEGNDVINGGAGVDWMYYDTATAGVSLNLRFINAQNTIGAGSDRLVSIENLLGSHYADTLTGSDANNILSGGNGNDVINGGAGNDSLIGGAGKDTYVLQELGAVTDNLKIAAGESLVGSFDVASYFKLGTGSANTGFIDKLDLVNTTIAANVAAVNGLNSGLIHSHSISSGLIRFDDVDSYTAPLALTHANLAGVCGYLQANIVAGNTVAFVIAADTYVFQDGGVNDTLIKLVGVIAHSVDTTGVAAGAVWIA